MSSVMAMSGSQEHNQHDRLSQVTYARRVQTSALFVALIAAGAFVSIPLPFSPVPIVLQNFFVVATGSILTAPWAAVTVAVYLAMGAIGLPVFAGATGGLSHFAGPTGGFLVGFLFSAVLTSLILHKGFSPPGTNGSDSDGIETQHGGYNDFHLILALFVGFLMPYLFGLPWLSYTTGLSLKEALPIGMIPFLPGDLVKGILLFFLIRRMPQSIWRRLK